jgi:signal transduction histidine kinase
VVRIDRTNLVIYIANIVFLIVGIGVLLLLQRSFVRDRDASIDSIKGMFSRERVLKGREDIGIKFSQIESIARINRRNIFIRDLYVSKIIANVGEHLVHPFVYAALHADWRARLERFRREPLVENGTVYGYLYIDLDERPIITVRVATVGLAVLLVVVLLVLMSRLRTQEKVITKTTVELEERRQEMIRLERLALAGQLTANIFHDIKKPVLNIKHEIADLARQMSNLPTGAGQLEGIQRHVDLFFAILRDLNIERFVRAGDREKEYVDVNDLLDRAVQLVKYERGGTEIQKHCEAALPPVLAHPYKIIQVFSNIILNAFQAMEGKGTLTLRTMATEAGIRVEIADTGPGISPEHLDNIFTPFFTTRSQHDGAGLGLYISKNIIDELQGEITVESSENVGTCFSIVIPVPAEAPTARESPATASSVPPKTEGTA